jgi:hypothetical protein
VPDEAIKLLKELLPNAFPQIGIVDADWNQLNNLYATRGEINIFDLLFIVIFFSCQVYILYKFSCVFI